MGIRVRTLLFFILLPLYAWAADQPRPAIVVLDRPCVIEELAGELTNAPDRARRIRERLHSDEGTARAGRLRALKAGIAGAIQKTGAQITGQTEIVLNSIHVLATEAQLEAIHKIPGVVSADWAREYHLMLDAAVPMLRVPEAWQLPAIGGSGNAGAGVKVAVIDSGIDHTHPMFQDASLPPAPCDGSVCYPLSTAGYQTSTTNKVIVARSYISCSAYPGDCSPMDGRGHGTFVAAIIGGGPGQSTSPPASLSGVAPKVYLGNYRIFNASGTTSDSTVVITAVNQAVADGMDIINLSLGSQASAPPLSDPDYIVYDNVTKAGVLVVAAAGNSGPGARTVAAPCIFPQVVCVGSVTNARPAAVSILSAAPVPAALASIAANPATEPWQSAAFGPAPLVDISTLDPTGYACLSQDGSANLPSGSLTGKIALVSRGGGGTGESCYFSSKLTNVAAAGGVGAIIYDNVPTGIVHMRTPGATMPSMSIGNADGFALKAFLAQNQASARFDPMAGVVISDSSRGPGPDLAIKPDVTAPGETILSATQWGNVSGEMYDPSRFTVASGTSFATPMVVGIAALVKQAHPTWTPKQLKSAVVNTAIKLTANTQDRQVPGALNSGAGRVDALAAVTATILADPVSLSFDNQTSLQPGQFRASSVQQVSVTNAGAVADTFSVTVVPVHTSDKVNLTLSTNSLAISAGGNAAFNLTVTCSGAPWSSSEGVIEIRGPGSGAVIRVPYWVSSTKPAVSTGGVVNGASYTSASGVTPGSIVSIFGTALASLSEANAAATPLPIALGGSEVLIKGFSAPIFYASGLQVNVQIPFDVTPFSVGSTYIKVDGAQASFTPPAITNFNPGLFSLDGSGTGSGAILRQDYSVLTSANPANPGETVMVYATGLGALDSNDGSPPAAGSPAPLTPLFHTAVMPTATIDGQNAPVVFSGLAPLFVGLYQVNVTLPQNLAVDRHTLVLTISGVASNPVYIFTR